MLKMARRNEDHVRKVQLMSMRAGDRSVTPFTTKDLETFPILEMNMEGDSVMHSKVMII